MNTNWLEIKIISTTVTNIKCAKTRYNGIKKATLRNIL